MASGWWVLGLAGCWVIGPGDVEERQGQLTDAETDGETGTETDTDPDAPCPTLLEQAAPDGDEDGLADGYESRCSGTDPAKADTDGDSLPDGAEVLDGGTDPLDLDSDDDGLADGGGGQDAEDRWATSPTNPDTDGDGLTDGLEVGRDQGIPAGADGVEGTEEAWVPDAHPASATDPLVTDTDADGLQDGQEDVNADGRADGDQPGTTADETDPTLADTDGDGPPDGAEGGTCAASCPDYDGDDTIDALDPDDANENLATAETVTADPLAPLCIDRDLAANDGDWYHLDGLGGAPAWVWVDSGPDTTLVRTDRFGNAEDDAQGLPFGVGTNPALGVAGRDEAWFEVRGASTDLAGTYRLCVTLPEPTERLAPTPFAPALWQIAGTASRTGMPDYANLDGRLWRVGIPGDGAVADPLTVFDLYGDVVGQNILTTSEGRGGVVGMVPDEGTTPPDAGLMSYAPTGPSPTLGVVGEGPYLLVAMVEDSTTEDAGTWSWVAGADGDRVVVSGKSDGEITIVTVPNDPAYTAVGVHVQAKTVGAGSTPTVRVDPGVGTFSPFGSAGQDASGVVALTGSQPIRVYLDENGDGQAWFLTLIANEPQ